MGFVSIAPLLEIKLFILRSYSSQYIITTELPLSALVTMALFSCNLPFIWFLILNSSVPFLEFLPLCWFCLVSSFSMFFATWKRVYSCCPGGSNVMAFSASRARLFIQCLCLCSRLYFNLLLEVLAPLLRRRYLFC